MALDLDASKLQQHPVHCAPSPLSIELAESLFNAPDPKMFADGPFWSLALPEVPVMFGRPNISGQHNIPNGNRSGDALYVDARGCFGYVSQASQTGNAGADGVGCRIDINASRSSAIFGVSTTVQPSSMMQLACIKI